MAQPTLPTLSGAAKVSFFDRINGQKNDIRLRKSIFFSETFNFVALVRGSRKSKRNRRTSPPHGGDWRKHGETTNDF